LTPPPLFPEYENVDWRNSGLQKRSGAGEKSWKVRAGTRGVLKGVSPTPVGDEGPAISIKASISSTQTSSRMSSA
jgi:autophagy-related protein 2